MSEFLVTCPIVILLFAFCSIRTGPAYKFTVNYKLQLSILQHVGAIAKHVSFRCDFCFLKSVAQCFWTKAQTLLPPANEVYEGYVFTGVCLSTGGGGACMVAGGHAWLLGGMCGCRGCVHGCVGVCMVKGGGMHGEGGCVVKVGHLWQRGACLAKGGVHGIWWDTINERAVCILLECILVNIHYPAPTKAVYKGNHQFIHNWLFTCKCNKHGPRPGCTLTLQKFTVEWQ